MPNDALIERLQSHANPARAYDGIATRRIVVEAAEALLAAAKREERMIEGLREIAAAGPVRIGSVDARRRTLRGRRARALALIAEIEAEKEQRP